MCEMKKCENALPRIPFVTFDGMMVCDECKEIEMGGAVSPFIGL